MCYRVSTPAKYESVEAEFQARLEDPDQYTPYYHLTSFSGQSVPVITFEDPKTVKLLAWKSHESFNSLNARCEEIFLPKKYYKSFTSRRGIIAVSGFFESHDVPKFSKNGALLKSTEKYPYYISLDGKPCFGIACLISHFNTVSLLTTEANSLMAAIHNSARRMPVILRKEDYHTWLREDLTEAEVKNLMIPFESALMSAHPISKLIYSKTENSNVVNATERVSYDASIPVFVRGEIQ